MGKLVKEYYLREFDYLPESVGRYAYATRLNFKEGVEKGVFKIFSDYESALRSSIEVRRILGLKTDWLEEKLAEMDFKKTERLLSDLMKTYVKKKNNDKVPSNYPKSIVGAFDSLMREIESYETKS